MSRFTSMLFAPFRRFFPPTPLVTVVALRGAIGVSGPGGRGLSASSVEASLVKAFKNKRSKAIVVSINSPGGAPAQSRMIMERIRSLSIEKQIPVISYIEDVGASGGYMIALAGEEIFADPFAIVGSIGVISAGFGFQDLIAKAGVERRVHTAGTNKMRLDPFQAQKDEDREKFAALLEGTHKLFIDMVKTSRGDRITGDPDIAFSGDFFPAGEGEALGLIDGVGDLRAILKERYGTDVKIETINSQKSGLLARLTSGASAALVDAAFQRVDDKTLRGRFGL
ncbi:MAG: S49 family peptidase [Pseudomonadota bacterium]